MTNFCRVLLASLALAAFLCATPAGAVTIYGESFEDTGVLHETTVDVAPGGYGAVADAVWTDASHLNNEWSMVGGEAKSTYGTYAGYSVARVPLVPETGKVYTYSLQLGTATPNWVCMMFRTDDLNNIFGGSVGLTIFDNNSIKWIRLRSGPAAVRLSLGFLLAPMTST